MAPRTLPRRISHRRSRPRSSASTIPARRSGFTSTRLAITSGSKTSGTFYPGNEPQRRAAIYGDLGYSTAGRERRQSGRRLYVNGTTGATEGFIVNLGTLAFTPITPPGSTATTATGINNSDVISGFYTLANGNADGFLDSGGTFIPLSFGADTDTMALGLNNKDQVVGSYVDVEGNTDGFVYNWVTGVLTTVDNPNADGTTAFGVEGTIVNGINDKGQLVGFYANTDQPAVNGFLANPVPEPSTWAMMLVGFAGLGFFGYRASRQRSRQAQA